MLTQKAADLMLFIQIIEIMSTKEHLIVDGLHKIINIIASMNWGLSDLLKSEFSNFTPVDRPIINTTIIPDSQWVAGFVCGEGCFFVEIFKSKTHNTGHQVKLRFQISQHERDKHLMELIMQFLGSGTLYKSSRYPVVDLTIVRFKDLIEKIIPLFFKISISWRKKFRFSRLMRSCEINDWRKTSKTGWLILNSIDKIKNEHRKKVRLKIFSCMINLIALGYILTLGFIITTFGMALWLRDVVTEAMITTNFNNILI